MIPNILVAAVFLMAPLPETENGVQHASAEKSQEKIPKYIKKSCHPRSLQAFVNRAREKGPVLVHVPDKETREEMEKMEKIAKNRSPFFWDVR